ncbi:MAG: S-layer homology domain-containing protein [Oscillospiraceae bacterium]|nr:S-layer homology domain-containing protein [Oscillospiraceae bacterium]
MKKRFLSAFLVFILLAGLTAQGTASAASALNPQQVYQSMIALKEQYPDGTPWTNDNYYGWHGGIFSGGYGCAGFAFMLSDAAFGTLPARKLTQFTFSDIRVGDILRIDNNSHSVIVLEVHDNSVVIAEGNYNRSVHWGRTLTSAQIQAADYIITRYPGAGQASVPVPEPTTDPVSTPASTPKPVFAFTDVPSWFEKEVAWAVEKKITNGYGGSATFAPTVGCPHTQILTFLWRAEGKPQAAKAPITVAAYYQDAVNWAYEKGLIDTSFNPGALCTRAQAVRYIWQALGRQEAKTAASFSDVAAGASYADAVSWAVEKGVTKGYGGSDTFAPDRVCNRGEIAAFLYRAYNN